MVIDARHEPQPYEEQLSADVELSILPADIESEKSEKKKSGTSSKSSKLDENGEAEGLAQAKAISTYRSLSNALSMPSFNLNITNRHSSTLLISLIVLQLVSNLVLITLLMIKLG